MKTSTLTKRSRRILAVRRRIGRQRIVYSQWDPQSQRKVVIKRYANAKQADKERRVMASYTQSPYLVNLITYYTRGGRGYIVMEWVEGRSIKRWIQRRGKLPVSKTVAIALNILTGLDTLHQNGYIHGDLITDNVVVTDLDAASIKIIDFEHAAKINSAGKARLRRHLPEPPYKLPPETSKKSVGVTYDIYGVGYICACMISGEFLKRRPTRPTRSNNLSALESALWKVIRRAMRRNPKYRYQSAREMAEALKRAVAVNGSENQSTCPETVR